MSQIRRVAEWLLAAFLAVLVTGCMTFGDYREPIASVVIPAPTPAPERTMVIVLPGFGSDLETMKEKGVAEAVHRGWPHADVVLTSATFAYYKHRNIIERLDRDVIEPARRDGYRHIWIAGASIGAMGVLFYEYAHPKELEGYILLAPWLGDSPVQDEVRAAGGVRAWDPGPKPPAIADENYQREMWRVVKDWSADPKRAKQVWLVCGAEDRMLEGSRLLAQALPADHYLEIPGGHHWETFVRAAELVSKRIHSSQ